MSPDDASGRRSAIAALTVVLALLSIASPAGAQLEAYLDQTSYHPGDVATVYISSPDSVVQYWLERRGANDVVHLSGTWSGLTTQAVPDSSFAYGCGWSPSEQFQLGVDWPTGGWTLRLRGIGSGTWEHVPLTLKPAVGEPKKPIACVRPISTLAAYNAYGGASYYYPSHAQRAHVVSFERPWANFGWARSSAAVRKARWRSWMPTRSTTTTPSTSTWTRRSWGTARS